jgi:exodeoxyribonuclease-3
MSKIVSHTPVEVEAFKALMGSMGFLNLLREATPEPEKLASWWSYRAADFRQSNRGLLLDHILISPGLREAAFAGGKPSSRVLDHVREWERPSDHAPVIADFQVP